VLEAMLAGIDLALKPPDFRPRQIEPATVVVGGFKRVDHRARTKGRKSGAALT
jgi:hypothetical protein